MRIKSILSIVLLLSFSAIAQQNQFAIFAAKQDSLFIKAYEQKNIERYQQLLNEFIKKYYALDADEQRQFNGYTQNAYYNLCCTYSLLNNKAQALQYLQKAVVTGYSNYAHLQADQDLDNIRDESAFKQIMQSLRATGDYVFILKNSAAYNLNDNRQLPAFSYQSADNPSLAALRRGFNLDSIAGEGNDISKMINLMHWVHTMIPHDGNHPNPQEKNALNLMTVCKKENRGLNCRGLATVLNECYLAMGFKSRFVTCLPKDSLKTDPDCHVINIVYEPQMRKWLWMDPTNDAYVMNEKGELLSIEEVRQRIVNDQPLILNPNANWNNKVSKTKEDYLFNYMAKNLYMLQCNARSEYNAETTENGKSPTYITLVPTAYFNQSKSVAEKKDETNNSVYRYYQTNNPADFWRLP
jgi:hypothetical protein